MAKPPERPSASIEVEVSNTQSLLAIDSSWIERVVSTTLSAESISRAWISVVVVDDASIQVINARHLGHDWPTDVITFPDSTAEPSSLVGELVVSAEMAVQSALQGSCKPHQEFALYLVHGLLHLCGYDDQSPAASVLIRRREAEVLAILDIENPFGRLGQVSLQTDEAERESVRWPR